MPIMDMDTVSRQFLNGALTLRDSERAALAAKPVDSLDPTVDGPELADAN